MQAQDTIKQSTDVDIFAFGLCMLELHTQMEMDPQQAHNHAALIETVADEGARSILSLCLLTPQGARPSAHLLMDQPYFSAPKKQPQVGPLATRPRAGKHLLFGVVFSKTLLC